MKIKIFWITTFIALFCGYKAMAQDSLRHVIHHDGNVVISVAKVLYIRDQDSYSYLKFTIKNIGRKKIGIDLRNPIKQYYPNHWDCYGYFSVDGLAKGESSRGRVVQTENDYERLNSDFAGKRLIYISPKKEYFYYRNIFEWKSEEPLEQLKRDNPFKVLLDGQLLITDGKKVNQYRLDNKEAADKVVIFSQPLVVKKIEEKDFPHIIKVVEVREPGE